MSDAGRLGIAVETTQGTTDAELKAVATDVLTATGWTEASAAIAEHRSLTFEQAHEIIEESYRG